MAQAQTEQVVAKLQAAIGQLTLDKAIMESMFEVTEQELVKTQHELEAASLRVIELEGLLEEASKQIADLTAKPRAAKPAAA